MTEPTDTADCWVCPTHKAVRAFAGATFAALARKVVFRLQRMKASGIYDHFRYRTLWDEYCHEVQHGPHEPLETAWDVTLDPLAAAVVEAVPHAEATLLTVGAAWDLDQDEVLADGVAPYPDLMRENLRRHVAELASTRDLSRFDPDMDGWR